MQTAKTAATAGDKTTEEDGSELVMGVLIAVGGAMAGVVVDPGPVTGVAVVPPDEAGAPPAAGAAAAAAVMESFIPPLQWPGVPHMK